MKTRPVRVPNTETGERKAARLYREEIAAEHRAFLENFDRQVEEIQERERRAAQQEAARHRST